MSGHVMLWSTFRMLLISYPLLEFKVMTISSLSTLDNRCSLVILGFLIARSYAISDRKRVVLVVLGIVGCCTIIPQLVRSYIGVFLSGEPDTRHSQQRLCLAATSVARHLTPLR